MSSRTEIFARYPARELEEVLQSCLWERITRNTWEKGRSRIFVDDIGIFLYRLLRGKWVRTCGLSHTNIRSLHEQIIIFPDFKLNLLSGE